MLSSSQVSQWPLPIQPLSFSTRDGDFRNGDGDYRAHDPRICFRGAAHVIQGAFLQEVFECLVPVGSLATSRLPAGHPVVGTRPPASQTSPESQRPLRAKMYLSVRLHTYPERSKAGQGERTRQWLALQDPTGSGTGHSHPHMSAEASHGAAPILQGQGSAITPHPRRKTRVFVNSTNKDHSQPACFHITGS